MSIKQILVLLWPIPALWVGVWLVHVLPDWMMPASVTSTVVTFIAGMIWSGHQIADAIETTKRNRRGY